jgi:hypothetical protein
MTSRSRTELIRPAGFSTAGNPIRDSGTAPASLAAPPPTVLKITDKDPHPAAIASTNPSAQAVVSTPRSVGDNSASQPSQEQPRGNSFFETGFGHLRTGETLVPPTGNLLESVGNSAGASDPGRSTTAHRKNAQFCHSTRRPRTRRQRGTSPRCPWNTFGLRRRQWLTGAPEGQEQI